MCLQPSHLHILAKQFDSMPKMQSHSIGSWHLFYKKKVDKIEEFPGKECKSNEILNLCTTKTFTWCIKRLWILLRHLRQQPPIPMFSINITVHDCRWIKSHGRHSHTWLGCEKFRRWENSNENMLSSVNHSLFRFVLKIHLYAYYMAAFY